MSKLELITNIVFFLFVFVSAFFAGATLLKLLKIKLKDKKNNLSFEHVGASFMLGLGILAYSSLILGFLNIFSRLPLFILTLSFLAIGLALNKDIYSSLLDQLKITIKNITKSPVFIITIFISIAILASLFLASMLPPHASDELHYHFPQVKSIVTQHKIDIEFGGHPFYGRIPKLMDVIFAYGTALSGYQLAHSINLAILISFLFVVFGIIKKHFGIKAATFSIFLLLLYDDFTWNATTGYVDAATVSFEISSLLFAIEWTIEKKRESLYIAGVLLGIALSMKYSPIPTAVFIVLMFAISNFIEKNKDYMKLIKQIGTFTIVALIFGGFWYIKNLILYKNPFYPLYFGHQGYGEIEFKSLVEAIQQFGPKTPQNYFLLTKWYLTITGLSIFASIYLAPLIIFVKTKRKFSLTLLTYFVLYNLYWFLFATHQIRFLMPAIVVSTIILAIILSKVKTSIILFSVFICVTLAGLNNLTLNYYLRSWKSFWDTKLHLVERQYALGNISEMEFLERNFGCQYSVIRYLEDNNLEGNVIDNWSVWHAPSVSFFANNNGFMHFYGDKNDAFTVSQKLKDGNIKYVYYNSKVKEKHLSNEDQIVKSTKEQKLPAENLILEHSELIFAKDSCKLFKIDINKI